MLSTEAAYAGPNFMKLLKQKKQLSATKFSQNKVTMEYVHFATLLA